jgi:molybdopterin-biosynthesis enzyme MoeA-like protein
MALNSYEREAFIVNLIVPDEISRYPQRLYDEWYSGQGKRRTTRCLEFRNTGQTESELKTKIHELFDKAKKNC